MTEKEAIEIVEKYGLQLKGQIPPVDDFIPVIENFRAMGYIEAIEKVEKTLIKRLQTLANALPPNAISMNIGKALAEWEKVK